MFKRRIEPGDQQNDCTCIKVVAHRQSIRDRRHAGTDKVRRWIRKPIIAMFIVTMFVAAKVRRQHQVPVSLVNGQFLNLYFTVALGKMTRTSSGVNSENRNAEYPTMPSPCRRGQTKCRRTYAHSDDEQGVGHGAADDAVSQ